MDWDNDGSIHFKEFLLAFVSWVGLEDEDEDAKDAAGKAQLKQ
jgi:calcium-binding protein CML